MRSRTGLASPVENQACGIAKYSRYRVHRLCLAKTLSSSRAFSCAMRDLLGPVAGYSYLFLFLLVARLVESDYGLYEGLRLDESLSKSPDWQLFRGGESPAHIEERSDRVVKRVRTVTGKRTALFALFRRTLHSRVDRQLAGARFGVYGQVFSIAPGEPKSAQL
jgi:hypothetical protein